MPVRSAKIRVLDNTLQDRHSQSLRKAGIGDYLLLLSAAGMWGGTFLLNEIALVAEAHLHLLRYDFGSGFFRADLPVSDSVRHFASEACMP